MPIVETRDRMLLRLDRHVRRMEDGIRDLDQVAASSERQLAPDVAGSAGFRLERHRRFAAADVKAEIATFVAIRQLILDHAI